MQFVVPEVVSESQCGYRPGRSTEDLIFVMHQLFEKPREKNTPMYAVFVDFTKAFDSVDRELLWEVLAHQGVPSKSLNALQNLHRNMEGCVSYGGNCRKGSPCTRLLAMEDARLPKTVLSKNIFTYHDKGPHGGWRVESLEFSW